MTRSNPQPETITDCAALLADDAKLIDVRSPGEFAQGAVPNAVNLPILDDAERARVGTCYRQDGHEAAVELGHSLVAGATRAGRIAAWQAAAGDAAALYCARGGLRSQIAQRWLADAGTHLPRVAGGFKALRSACLDVLATPPSNLWVVGGRTGCGKTLLVNDCPSAIDLEGLANHRGSAFGGFPEGQPTPIDFENALATAALRHAGKLVVLEDESRTIARLAIPQAWHEAMQGAPVVMVTAPLEERVRNVRAEYVDAALASGVDLSALHARYRDATDRIRKRLGGHRHSRLVATMDAAFSGASPTARHEDWIRALLEEYYDPMYDYQLDRKRDRIRFEGSRAECLAFLLALASEAG